MKKFGLIIFISALVFGVIFANVFDLGTYGLNMPISVFKSKTHGSGNITTQKREIGDFEKIEISGGFDVEIVLQSEKNLEITGDDNLLSLVRAEVNDGVLEIERKERYSSKKGIKIKIANPSLKELDISGASVARIANINEKDFKLDLSGASKVFPDGSVENFVIDSSGASIVDAFQLKAFNTNIDASGASKLSVNSSEKLAVDVSGATRVYYKGNPGEILKKTSGASSLKAIR